MLSYHQERRPTPSRAAPWWLAWRLAPWITSRGTGTYTFSHCLCLARPPCPAASWDWAHGCPGQEWTTQAIRDGLATHISARVCSILDGRISHYEKLRVREYTIRKPPYGIRSHRKRTTHRLDNHRKIGWMVPEKLCVMSPRINTDIPRRGHSAWKAGKHKNGIAHTVTAWCIDVKKAVQCTPQHVVKRCQQKQPRTHMSDLDFGQVSQTDAIDGELICVVAFEFVSVRRWLCQLAFTGIAVGAHNGQIYLWVAIGWSYSKRFSTCMLTGYQHGLNCTLTILDQRRRGK